MINSATGTAITSFDLPTFSLFTYLLLVATTDWPIIRPFLALDTAATTTAADTVVVRKKQSAAKCF